MGLLFGSDTDDSTEDLPEVLSFQHKLIQEMLAAYYVADQVQKDASILETAFPTWNAIKQHEDVVRFTCGLLASTETSAKPVVDHVSKVLVELTMNERKSAEKFSIMYTVWGFASHPQAFEILSSFQEEGSVYISDVNPYLAFYPACRHPLAELLAKTRLVYINGFNCKDAISVGHTDAYVILDVSYFMMRHEDYHRLWKVLQSTTTKLLAIDIDWSEHDNDDPPGEDFAEQLTRHVQSHHIASPENQLMRCYLSGIPIPTSLLSCLGECNHLRYLDFRHCHLKSIVNVLVASPPPSLRVLILAATDLCADDIHQIAEGVRQKKLLHLKKLDISQNIVGEPALACLLEALQASRIQGEHELLQLALGASVNAEVSDSSSDESEQQTPEPPAAAYSAGIFDDQDWAHWDNLNDVRKSRDPSDKFIRKWSQKLRESNIKVAWHMNYFPQ